VRGIDFPLPGIDGNTPGSSKKDRAAASTEKGKPPSGEKERKTDPEKRESKDGEKPERPDAQTGPLKTEGKTEDVPAERRERGECPARENAEEPETIKMTLEGEPEDGAVEAEVERTPMDEEGEGEGIQTYGVEVQEYLEMEPVDGTRRRQKKFRPYNKFASVLFIIAFVLGVLNAGAVLIYHSSLVTPDELLSGGVCELTGEVKDVTGAPIANASITVSDSSQATFTNPDGWYILKGVPPGKHRVEAAASGYNTFGVRVNLEPNLLKSIDYTLEKEGADVYSDESAAADFNEAASSYLWAAPLLIFFSAFALVAAMLALRRDASRMVVLTGALSVASMGFWVGSVLALAGTMIAGVALSRKRTALKKIRLGVAYPRVADGEDGEPVCDAAPGIPEESGYGESVPAGGYATPPVKAGSRGRRVHRHTVAKRFLRRSPRGRIVCCVCRADVLVGEEYIRCVCRKTIHISCLMEPVCPECNHPFGRWKHEDI
jgi:hypothetical protein